MAHNQPLKVLIVGAGIGGLTAAIALRQQGHHIEIFEKSRLTSEAGAAIQLTPNCVSLLNRLGIYPETFGATILQHIVSMKSSGELVSQMSLDEGRKGWKTEWYSIQRIDLHNGLKRKATADDAKGVSATLHRGCVVSNIDCETATIELADGQKISGDIVIAADGVHSRARNLVTGGDYQTFSSGKSCYRWLMPALTIKQDPTTQGWVEKPGAMTEVVGDDRRVMLYPCVTNDQVIYTGAFLPTEEVGPTEEGWGRVADKAKLLSSYSNFAPEIQKLLQKAPEDDIRTWDLLDMDVLNIWTNSCCALLGDAAHPFLPYMGQGGAMAIEDAVSIAVLLPLGTKVAEIPGRLKLYQNCRKERVDRIQQFTRLRGRDPSGKQGPPPSGLEVMEFSQYCIDHDEWNYSTVMLQNAVQGYA